PRLDVAEGEHVDAGQALCHHRDDENLKITAPVSGTVKEVRRGARRKIEAIVISPDDVQTVKHFDKTIPPAQLLAQSGLLAMIRQRPYDIVPMPSVAPRDIFVSCFDSAPLAPSLSLVLGDGKRYLQAGVDALASLTQGKVYLGIERDEDLGLTGCEINVFRGPHPAGNAGVQIANVKPVNKGDVVWTLDVVTLARIGRLFTEGVVDYSTVVALTGELVENPRYLSTVMGADLHSIIDGNLVSGKLQPRIISGNVLTGTPVEPDGFLRAPYRHITVIPENARPDEFMGWASLSPKRFSIYRLFTSWLTGNRNVHLDARISGGERAIVMAGEYDRMLPMDIYAEFLIKAIIAFDIDKMEQLGIYEVAPEDFALAEFADTSKLELQRIVRDGLDKMRKEMS
ncbi:MAG: Na(+)-translocating NADH-quinone reductase subunit A, partial [Muribaculaceae bacterium]|nr:Na(+)-translocating NADH-quinone reductase subunit A [Muribaculaceae bacterium]